MPAIATLTMNPAIDVSASVARLRPESKLRCKDERRDPGGGGVNMARVITRLGGEVTAVFPAGGFVGGLLSHLVQAEGVRSLVVPIRGDTREDFSVRDDVGEQFRFVFSGPTLSRDELAACLQALAEMPRKPAFTCASGSLPPGAPDDFYASLARTVRAHDSRLVLDTSGPALRAALDEGVYLVKPNLRELRELTGEGLGDTASRLTACRALIGRAAAEVVALTLGPEGALLVTADQAWLAAGLPIKPLSTVGAGDSFLAALVLALSRDAGLNEALRQGVAAGSAALLADGTELALPEDVRRLAAEVVVEAI